MRRRYDYSSFGDVLSPQFSDSLKIELHFVKPADLQPVDNYMSSFKTVIRQNVCANPWCSC